MLQASFCLAELWQIVAVNTLVIQRILANKEKVTPERDRNYCLKNFIYRSDCIFPFPYSKSSLW